MEFHFTPTQFTLLIQESALLHHHSSFASALFDTKISTPTSRQRQRHTHFYCIFNLTSCIFSPPFITNSISPILLSKITMEAQKDFHCTCGRVFTSWSASTMHLRDNRAHKDVNSDSILHRSSKKKTPSNHFPSAMISKAVSSLSPASVSKNQRRKKRATLWQGKRGESSGRLSVCRGLRRRRRLMG